MMREKITVRDFIEITFKYANLWTILIPMHIIGIGALCFANMIYFSMINLLYLVAGWFCIMILGVTAGLHRMLSHKSFKTWSPMRYILLFFGILSGQGSPVFWAVIHRYNHHPNSDRMNDLHSPINGFWHSWFLWLWKIEPADIDPRRAVEFLHDPFLRVVHRYYVPIWWIINCSIALVDIEFWICFAIIPSLITFHSYSIINSITHLKNLGYINFQTKDNSRNIWWLWPVIFGDCWHNNHHGNPKAFNFKNRWWEIDPAGIVINLIKKSN